MRRAIILGAAGRDFHNFHVFFKNNPDFEVACFTAAQIPFISDRVYPAELTGKRYPNGIPIKDEDELENLIEKYKVKDVFFSYSDISFERVMRLACRAMAKGASFHLLSPEDTWLISERPVIAITGVRTGAGKSTVSREVFKMLKRWGRRPVVVRHPMPYLGFYESLRFETREDLNNLPITIEEREEFELHIENGAVVYCGVNYRKILDLAEREGDVIIWDGGNNDFPFYKPDIYITVVDANRAGQELGYYPGEVNLRRADIVILNKVNLAKEAEVRAIRERVKGVNAKAVLLEAASEPILVPDINLSGKKVLVVEDGPTVTHGGLSEAAGAKAARKAGGILLDPKNYARGSIRRAYEEFPHIGHVLPALGYSKEQVKELEESINSTPADVVVLGTPADLSRLMYIEKPMVKVRLRLRFTSVLKLDQVLWTRFKKLIA